MSTQILFVNACVRGQGVSRTLDLAHCLLEQLKKTYPDAVVTEASLEKDRIAPLYADDLEYRNQCFAAKRFDDPIYRYAHQLSSCDYLVIAAPFWDNSYPAVLKAWIEQVMAQGVTFGYTTDGTEFSLCKAQKFWYVCTAGGKVERNYGFEHVESLMRDYFHVPEGQLVQADCIDLAGYDGEKILRDAKDTLAALTAGGVVVRVEPEVFM